MIKVLEYSSLLKRKIGQFRNYMAFIKMGHTLKLYFIKKILLHQAGGGRLKILRGSGISSGIAMDLIVLDHCAALFWHDTTVRLLLLSRLTSPKLS